MKLRCAGYCCSIVSPDLRLQLGERLGDGYCPCKAELEWADYLQRLRRLRPRPPLVGVVGVEVTA